MSSWTLLEVAVSLYAAVISLISLKLFRMHFPGMNCLEKSYGEQRRRLAFPSDKLPPSDIRWIDRYRPNSRGMLLYTQSYLPLNEPRAIVFMCVGYGDNGSWLPRERCVKLARAGFAVFAMDYEGMGRSDGLHGYVPDFNQMVDDALEYFTEVRQQYPKLKTFLMGESMGGAVSIKLGLHKRGQGHFHGVVLMAPMVKIADSMKPAPFLINILTKVAHIAPTLPIVPSPDVLEKAFKEKAVLHEALRNPYAYRLKPRLGTALQLLYATDYVSSHMEDFKLPVLVLQGTHDAVTDPALAQEFYRRASSQDKTLKLYEGCFHALMGEPESQKALIFKDIFDWLEARA